METELTRFITFHARDVLHIIGEQGRITADESNLYIPSIDEVYAFDMREAKLFAELDKQGMGYWIEKYVRGSNIGYALRHDNSITAHYKDSRKDIDFPCNVVDIDARGPNLYVAFEHEVHQIQKGKVVSRTPLGSGNIVHTIASTEDSLYAHFNDSHIARIQKGEILSDVDFKSDILSIDSDGTFVYAPCRRGYTMVLRRNRHVCDCRFEHYSEEWAEFSVNTKHLYTMLDSGDIIIYNIARKYNLSEGELERGLRTCHDMRRFSNLK